MGLVTARNAVRLHAATQLTGLGSAIGTIIGEAFIPGISSVGGQELVGIAGTAMLRGYGRDHELEADRLGAEYLARSGYDPDAMLDVIGVLKNQESFELKLAREEGRQPRIYHGVFSTHPSSDTRLQEVVGYAYDIKEGASESTFIGRTEYLQRVDGMVYGESSDNGLIRGRDFYHGNMGFSMRFPERWGIQNLPDRLIAGANGGLALMQVMVQPADPRLSPKDYMAQRMGIDTSRAGQALTINGLPAYTTTAVLNTNVGKRLARVSVVYLQNMAFIIAGHTRDTNGLNRYDTDFLNTTRSFRPLSNAEREIANRTNRIRLIRADQGSNFDKLAGSSPLDKFPEEQLRLINAEYPSGEIESGELMKVIQAN
jgi:predicted Zn-dependent protease